jgi:hypothetical protein
MNPPSYPDISAKSLKAIDAFDQAISSHSFRPQYLFAGIGLIAGLEDAGRLTPMKDKDIRDLEAWLFDEQIVLLGRAPV